MVEQGRPGQWLGYPNDEYAVTNGTRVDFAGQTTSAIWTPQYGAVPTNGLIKAYWDARGGMTSDLGVPVRAMTPEAGGGWSQQFSKRRAWFAGSTGTYATEGLINSMYLDAGGPVNGFATPLPRWSRRPTPGTSSSRAAGWTCRATERLPASHTIDQAPAASRQGSDRIKLRSVDSTRSACAVGI